jgi:hypothetical protein
VDSTELILTKVCRAINKLAELGDQYGGLFPSIVSLDTLDMPAELPPNIPGQRNEDRAHPGSNLLHDKYTLATMYALNDLKGVNLLSAADRYLRRFAAHCTNTVTGLFPWGEHAFWDLKHDCIGNSFPLAYAWWAQPAIHDHLSAAPFWLWRKLYEYNPVCVERFAEGLDYHWREGEPVEYCRHANIEIKERPPREARSCDFPRHGGFYIMDWAFAYIKTGRKDFLQQVYKMLDYWWEKRDRSTAMLPLESKTPPNVTAIYGLTSPGQAMSLAMSLFETSLFLEHEVGDLKPESTLAEELELSANTLRNGTSQELLSLARTMWERAGAYANSFLMLPHDLENKLWVSCTRFDTGEVVSTMKCWGSVYGSGIAAGSANLCVGFYRMTNDERFLEFAESVARGYLDEPLPTDAVVPVCDAGTVIALFADLYDVTRERIWLEQGMKIASDLVQKYFDRELPRGEMHIEYYDSQMGSGIFLHSLARLALLATNPDQCPIGPDYSAR